MRGIVRQVVLPPRGQIQHSVVGSPFYGKFFTQFREFRPKCAQRNTKIFDCCPLRERKQADPIGLAGEKIEQECLVRQAEEPDLFILPETRINPSIFCSHTVTADLYPEAEGASLHISGTPELGAEEAGGRSLRPNMLSCSPGRFLFVAAVCLNEVGYASHMLLSVEPPRAATLGGFLLSL